MNWGMLDIDADRWTPFTETWQFEDEDLTGAALAMQIRLHDDASGPPLLSLGTVTAPDAQGLRLLYAGTASVSAHLAAGRIEAAPEGRAPGDMLTLSLVGCLIHETSMESLPFPQDRGAPVVLAYDLHVTPPGGFKFKALGGRFTVLPGATQ